MSRDRAGHRHARLGRSVALGGAAVVVFNLALGFVVLLLWSRLRRLRTSAADEARAAPTTPGVAKASARSRVRASIEWSGDSSRRLSKSFGQPVLRDVSLTVPAGCLYGLIGPGASGKSVLLKMITALMRPDSGSVVVDGEDVLAMTELELATYRRKFGMLFQNNALFDAMTVADNIAFPLHRMASARIREIDDRVQERLRAVSLPASATERQRVFPADRRSASASPARRSPARRSSSTTSRPRGSIR